MQKVVLVTAASKGIGHACAEHLSKAGWTPSMMARSDDVVTAADKLGGMGFVGDITKGEDLERFVEATLSRFGRLDAAVVNAGHSSKNGILDLSDTEWHQAMDVLFLPTVRIVRAAKDELAKTGGAVACISSFATVRPDGDFAASSAVRAALQSYIALAARTLAPSSVRINGVAPGFVDTRAPTEPRLTRIPMNRYAATAEVAEAVSFLISERSSYITGQMLVVDGGLTT